MRENILLSVIVPVYNVEIYLEKCIESILNQTYKNTQVILVDDGSTDSSGDICDRYSAFDSRILVIHQENKGLARARYEGLQKSNGEYIIWIDADDWIEKKYFEEMITEAVESECDLVVANLFSDIGDESRVIENNIPNGKYRVKDIVSSMLYNGIFYEYGIQPHGVTKLFKKNILAEVEQNMDFNITIGEDAAVVYPYILRAESICVTGICGYHYVQRPGSITKKNTTNEIKKIEVLIEYLKCIFDSNDILLSQVEIYKNYLLALRDLSYWDDSGVLYPYGGIGGIAIYGAGGMGLSLYAYCKKKKIPVIAWIDKNHEYYKSINMPVISVDEFKQLEDKCIGVFIANISEKIAADIKADLISNGIAEEKIRWFSKEFIRCQK